MSKRKQQRIKKLSKWQAKALGSAFTAAFWNPKLISLYPKPSADSQYDNDPTISQSYEEFVEMGNRMPNEAGTGRFLVGDDPRNSIAILRLKGDPYDPKLEEFIGAYFCMPVISVETELEFEVKPKSKKRAFKDMSTSTEFPLRCYKKTDNVDCFSVLDVLGEYLPRTAYTGVLLVDFLIMDSTGDPSQLIYGRACGDRVCVVSNRSLSTKREFYVTVVHELLHTFGVDHCESWACVMNPCVSSEEESLSTMELCPAELRKISTAIPTFNIKARFEGLKTICESEGWIDDAKWYQERIKCFDELP